MESGRNCPHADLGYVCGRAEWQTSILRCSARKPTNRHRLSLNGHPVSGLHGSENMNLIFLLENVISVTLIGNLPR